MATKKTNGQRVRELREARFWTQEQLSEVSDVSLRSIQRVEKGEAVSMETLKNLAATFDVDADELVLPPKEPARDSEHTLRILPRITTGKQFGRLADCEGYLFDHEEPSSDSEVGTIASFVSNLQDWGMIWGDLDAGQRIEAEQSMKSLLSELEDAGFWAFGEAYPYSVSSQDSKPPMRWQLACVVIKRKDFPGIVKPDESEENARLPALFPKKPDLWF